MNRWLENVLLLVTATLLLSCTDKGGGAEPAEPSPASHVASQTQPQPLATAAKSTPPSAAVAESTPPSATATKERPPTPTMAGSGADKTVPAMPPSQDSDIQEPQQQEAPPPPPMELTKALKGQYVGSHSLGVNRVTDGDRVGLATVVFEDGHLFLNGSVEKSPYNLVIRGYVIPNGLREFTLQGYFEGSPNLEWRGERAQHRRTQGQFVFRATGARKFWRMYLVDGKDCVCDDNCGNDFCYIDIGFSGPK